MAIIIKPPVSGGGGGAVDSVNGETGVVVLTTDNIDAGVNADRQYFTAALQTDLDAKADQTALDAVQDKTLYSNSYYVNDGVNDIQAVLDDIAGSTGVSAIYVSAGSYGGSTVTISDHANVNILAPESPTGVHGCELLSRGLTISGASTTRIKIENLNIEGAFLINGTQGRHYFKNVIFDSTVTINNSTANFVTFEQCSFAGGISIASNVTATIYFDRCALGNQFVTSSRSGAGSPLLTILTECSGVNALQANLTSNVVLVGRTGFNSGSVVQYQNSDSYVYDLNNGLSTSFSGSYSELRNKPAIPTSSDDLTEGSSNLYYTNTRFDNRLATKTTDNLTEGSTNLYFTTARAKTAAVVNSMADNQTDQAPSVSSVKSYYTAGTGISLSSGQISSTITQYTDADADARITLQKGANNGICELDANGLVPTNHLPPLAITDVHVVADEAARLALIAQEGDVAIQTDDSSSWIYDGSAWVAFGVSGAVLSVNSQTGTVSLDTDDIPEGSTNRYFSDTLARTASVVDSTSGTETNQAPSVAAMKSYVLANAGAVNSVNSVSPVSGNVTLTTDNLTEGSSNLYYTNTRFDNRLGTKTTDDLSEGSTNLYYTSTRVNSAFDTRLATKTTDNLTEGTTNKYFSDTLARNAFSAGTGITITTGQIATTITQYTDTLAKAAAVVNSMAGSQTDQSPSVSSVKSYYTAGTGISITNGQISATGGGGGGSRPTYSTESSFPLNLGGVDYTGVIKRRYYISNGASAVTINLPAVASNDGLELTFKLLGTGAATIDANASETIDGALTLVLSAQNSAVNLIATSAGWRIE
jgi:IS5 family transposase